MRDLLHTCRIRAQAFPALALLAILALPTTAHAQVDEVANACLAGGQGNVCQGNSCDNNFYAKTCVAGKCEVRCDVLGVTDTSKCFQGETCVSGVAGGNTVKFCQPSAFRVDINIVDNAIRFFIDGIQPTFMSTPRCNLEANLNRLLNQDADPTFNIFDLDLVIRAFISATPCNPETRTCTVASQTYCASDDACGDGLYCNPTLHRCERECGLIGLRDGNLGVLDRECTGRLKVCDYDRGKCVPLQLDGTTCQIDADCPSGASCFLGECKPKCSRSIDCPNDGWYCSRTNTCLPVPSPSAPAGFSFNPVDYMVQFGMKNAALSGIENEAKLPLAIMNLRTKRQEFANAGIVFGYRLAIEYAPKIEAKCQKSPNDWTEAEVADCLIFPNEEFVTLLNPFGTVYAVGTPTIDLRLNPVAADRLSPGLYQATLTAIFNNGSKTSATIRYNRTTISGEYDGRISVYVDPKNLLTTTNLAMRLYIDQSAPYVQWVDFQTANNIAAQQDFIDITAGYPVTGTIHGADSAIFDWPLALTKAQDEIPVKGIYSPELGRMHLLAVVDIAADHCRSDRGDCIHAAGDLEVQNIFGRKIRRVMEFIGPFDPVGRMFHGKFRDTFFGLAPFEVTLDGGFRLVQRTPNGSELLLAAPLLTTANAAAVDFPSHASLLAKVNGDIGTYCGPDELNLGSESAWNVYLDSWHSGDGNDGALFEDLVNFQGQIESALSALSGAGAAGASLTLNDFLRGQILFCGPGLTDNCINEGTVRCGLALHQRAILAGYVDLASIVPGGAELAPNNPLCRSATPNPAFVPAPGCFGEPHPLFCSFSLETDGCFPAGSPAVLTLQEHNRFYQELSQTLKFQAGNELSDAFYVLYKSQDGDDFGQATALDYKQDRLFAAWDLYNKVRKEIFTSVPADILFRWPMRAFRSIGETWLKQMHRAVRDRMDALEEIVDLKRRIFVSADAQDFTFIQHLMHEEYLSQVFLITLQEQWQEELFAYAGSGEEIIGRADRILARVNDTRNPLGLHPDQVYFENSNRDRVNWQNYKDIILGNGVDNAPGLLAEVETAVSGAITNLKGALSDQNRLETELLGQNQQFQETIDNLCGPSDVAPSACDILDRDEQSVVAFSCASDVDGAGDPCTEVVETFQDGTGAGLQNIACRTDVPPIQIKVGDGTRRCIRGQMGAHLQEKVRLELQRTQTMRRVSVLLDQIKSQQQFITETNTENDRLISYLEGHAADMRNYQLELFGAEAAIAVASAIAGGLNCMVIVGVASGTDCAGSVAEAGMKIAAIAAHHVAQTTVGVLRERASYQAQQRQLQHSMGADVRRQIQGLDQMVATVENHIAEYEMVTQQLFNLQQRIADTQYLAQQAANRYSERVKNWVDHLAGSETGNAMLRNVHVHTANRKFHELLLYTYKMARAFIHSYNLALTAEQITNKVFRLMTPQDIRDFISELNTFEREYCGASGLDCDSAANTHYLRFSLRDELFPALTDVVDGRTGAVLTKGEQFHNLITSSRFVRRRQVAASLRDQIEVPFAIWANDRGEGAARPAMLDIDQCNHIIIGTDEAAARGTFAVNAVMEQGSGTLGYQLWRGNTDYLRSCDSKEVQPPGVGVPLNVWPVNIFRVGYAPQSALAQQNSPPTFLSQAIGLTACRDQPEVLGNRLGDAAPCWEWLARDRSLAAPDWKLVIPLSSAGNQWVMGLDADGNPLAEDARSIIGDLVLYFRYRTRPIGP